MSKEISFEILATGTWNGIQFNADRLKNIIHNFGELKDIHKPYLKIGHDDEQKLTDGEPALGWIDELWINGAGKLMAKAIDIPDILYEAIKKKLYKRVSVELDMDVEYKKENIGDVLTAVAILGADVPAVNTLSDLQVYMSNKGTIAGKDKVILTAIETGYTPKPKIEEINMDELERLSKKFDALADRFDKVETENKTLKEENDTLKADNKKFSADIKKRDDDARKEKIELSRSKATTMLENAVKSEKITPAQREAFSAMMKIDDDDAVQSIDFKVLEGLIGEKSAHFSSDSAHSKGEQKPELSVDEKVVSETQKIINANPGMSFSAAQERVFKADPKLAREYIDYNDGGKS